jgi:hypothetical protein
MEPLVPRSIYHLNREVLHAWEHSIAEQRGRKNK